MDPTGELGEFDVGGAVERRLVDADRAFDAGPVERLQALSIYAEFAPWIDPKTEIGRDRLRRVLSDPRPLDPRFKTLIALAGAQSADVEIRIASMFAAVRWALASDEHARAEASIRTLVTLCRQRGRPIPPSAHAAMCDVLTGPGREIEAVAALRRLVIASDERGGAEDRLWAARYRCGVLALAEAWDDVLAAVREFEEIHASGAAPRSIVLGNRPHFDAARALLGLGDPAGARARLARIDSAVLTRTEASRFLCAVRALHAEVAMAAGEPDAAFAAAVGVMQDDAAAPGTWCSALATALEVSAGRGDHREAGEVAATLFELLGRSGDRIGTGTSLRLFSRAFRVLEHAPADADLIEAGSRTAAEDLASRISELAGFVGRDGGLGHLLPDDTRVLVAYRRRAAADFGPLLRAVDPFLADARSDSLRRIDEAVGGLVDRRLCETCLSVWDDGVPEPLPIAHLLTTSLRDTLVPAMCPGCAAG